MSVNIEVGQNAGIISTGENAENTIIHNSSKGFEPIDWGQLVQEIEILKTSSDTSIKKFANEASEAVEKKDSGKIKSWLAKWIPCIGGLIETSYYILEISARLGISK